MNTRTLTLAACGIGLLAATSAAQSIAYDNFSPGNGYNSGRGWFVRGPNHASAAPDWTQGFQFTSLASGGITELLVPLSHTDGTNNLRFEVREDDNDTPGTVLGEFANITAPPTTDLVTIAGDGSIQLDAGETYWLVLFAINDGSGTWWQNEIDDNVLRVWSRDQGTTWNFGTVNAPAFRITVDDAPTCYADCNGDDVLNVADFLCFIDEFAIAQTLPPAQQEVHYANCTGATSEPFLTVADFLCFIDEFAQGCP